MTSVPLPLWEGEPTSVWSARWGVPRFEAWSRLPSTNDRVRELAGGAAPTWTTVVAEEQTAGRGRGGRAWSSPAGLGLWLSTLARPADGAGRLLLPLRAGLAAAGAVDEVAGLRAGVKWPNDLWVEGRKVAGILCEAAGGEGAVVVGVGVNVAQDPEHFPPELRGRAASLEALAGRAVPRGALAGAFLARLRAAVDEGSGTLRAAETEALGRRDLLAGRRVVLSTGLRGRAVGIAPDGALVVETEEGRRRALAGSVTDVEPPLARGAAGGERREDGGGGREVAGGSGP